MANGDDILEPRPGETNLSRDLRERNLRLQKALQEDTTVSIIGQDAPLTSKGFREKFRALKNYQNSKFSNPFQLRGNADSAVVGVYYKNASLFEGWQEAVELLTQLTQYLELNLIPIEFAQRYLAVLKLFVQSIDDYAVTALRQGLKALRQILDDLLKSGVYILPIPLKIGGYSYLLRYISENLEGDTSYHRAGLSEVGNLTTDVMATSFEIMSGVREVYGEQLWRPVSPLSSEDDKSPDSENYDPKKEVQDKTLDAKIRKFLISGGEKMNDVFGFMTRPKFSSNTKLYVRVYFANDALSSLIQWVSLLLNDLMHVDTGSRTDVYPGNLKAAFGAGFSIDSSGEIAAVTADPVPILSWDIMSGTLGQEYGDAFMDAVNSLNTRKDKDGRIAAEILQEQFDADRGFFTRQGEGLPYVTGYEVYRRTYADELQGYTKLEAVESMRVANEDFPNPMPPGSLRMLSRVSAGALYGSYVDRDFANIVDSLRQIAKAANQPPWVEYAIRLKIAPVKGSTDPQFSNLSNVVFLQLGKRDVNPTSSGNKGKWIYIGLYQLWKDYGENFYSFVENWVSVLEDYVELGSSRLLALLDYLDEIIETLVNTISYINNQLKRLRDILAQMTSLYALDIEVWGSDSILPSLNAALIDTSEGPVPVSDVIRDREFIAGLIIVSTVAHRGVFDVDLDKAIAATDGIVLNPPCDLEGKLYEASLKTYAIAKLVEDLRDYKTKLKAELVGLNTSTTAGAELKSKIQNRVTLIDNMLSDVVYINDIVEKIVTNVVQQKQVTSPTKLTLDTYRTWKILCSNMDYALARLAELDPYLDQDLTSLDFLDTISVLKAIIEALENLEAQVATYTSQEAKQTITANNTEFVAQKIADLQEALEASNRYSPDMVGNQPLTDFLARIADETITDLEHKKPLYTRLVDESNTTLLLEDSTYNARIETDKNYIESDSGSKTIKDVTPTNYTESDE